MSGRHDATSALAQGDWPRSHRQPLTKSEFVYREVRRRVRDGSLVPGTKLSLRSVAEALDVSMMPVRDALVRLADEGLVHIDSGREATVADISNETVLDALVLLTWNEVLATVESAPRQSPADLRMAHAALVATREATELADPIAHGKAARRFHHLLAQHASSATQQVITKVGGRITQAGPKFAKYQTYEFPEGHPGCMGSVQIEHDAILAAVEAGDRDQVMDTALRHRDTMLESYSWISGSARRWRAGSAPVAGPVPV